MRLRGPMTVGRLLPKELSELTQRVIRETKKVSIVVGCPIHIARMKTSPKIVIVLHTYTYQLFIYLSWFNENAIRWSLNNVN